MRDGIRKRFEFLVGAAQFLGQFGHLFGPFEHDAQQGAAKLDRQFDFAIVPGRADAMDGFAPAGKTAAWRQLPRPALVLRLAGPVDGLHHFRPEPQQIMRVDARNRHRQQAAGIAHIGAGRRMQRAQLIGMEHFAMAVRAQPLHQFAHLLFAGRVAVGQHAVVDDDGRAIRAGKAQQLGKHAAQAVGKVDLLLRQAGQHADHGAPHFQAKLQFAGVGARLDAQRQDLPQLFAHGALLERHRQGRFVMAGNQAPQLALDDQRHRHRRQGAHVAHILQVNRRDAAQGRMRQIIRQAGNGIHGRLQARRRVIGVLDQADTVEHVQLARLARNIAGGKALPQVGAVAVGPAFGQHMAMAIAIELVHHHAAKAGHVADLLCGQAAHLGDIVHVVDF